MSRRPAAFTQAEYARVVRVAKQAGAAEVEIRVGETSYLIRFAPSTVPEQALNPKREIVL